MRCVFLFGVGLNLAVLFTFAQAVAETIRSPASLSSDEVLRIAGKTTEAQAFLSWASRWESCVRVAVRRPCETDWVTCIEEAWVVTWRLDASCSGLHDPRLGLTLLMDDKTGEVISRYPEREYFTQPQFCWTDNNCSPLCRKEGRVTRCVNFVAVSTFVSSEGNMCGAEAGLCRCRSSVCRIVRSP